MPGHALSRQALTLAQGPWQALTLTQGPLQALTLAQEPWQVRRGKHTGVGTSFMVTASGRAASQPVQRVVVAAGGRIPAHASEGDSRDEPVAVHDRVMPTAQHCRI